MQPRNMRNICNEIFWTPSKKPDNNTITLSWEQIGETTYPRIKSVISLLEQLGALALGIKRAEDHVQTPLTYVGIEDEEERAPGTSTVWSPMVPCRD